MTRFLIAGALAVSALAATPSAQADPYTCTLRGCISQVGEAVCGPDHCGPVPRCTYPTDYALCIY
jgi:hypothetical protein